MGLFRSEEMTLCQLFLQSEAAYASISELGELGLVQFRDLNPEINAFQRKFVNEVRRCDEMDRKLRFLENEIKKDEIPMLDTGDNPAAPFPREMIDLEATFEKLENEMKKVNINAESLKTNYIELTQLKYILRKTQSFFNENQQESVSESENLVNAHEPCQLGFIAGVICRQRLPAFERMLWRVCHGNVFIKQSEIDIPIEDKTGVKSLKSVFIVFFQGDQLKSRVIKICEAFRTSVYPCPDTAAARTEMAIGVMTRIEDLSTVLAKTQDHRHRLLVSVAKNIKVWFIKVFKIKAIYHTLNQFNIDVTQKCFIGECWCPVDELDAIQLSLKRGTENGGSGVESILNRMNSKKSPPTYNRTNIFTSVFQSVVDAYGVARYQEVNPAPFTIISFPFLFSVMFGDTGHGAIMFLFALWMVIAEKKLLSKKSNNEIWNMFFGGRYIILLMGMFSMYSGLIYNDTFALSINVFGSSWAPNRTIELVNVGSGMATELQLDPAVEYSQVPYPFGMDPVWQLSTNKILFLNSFKMKMSVIFGITQMLFGVILSFKNHRFFKNTTSIFFEFIPQVVFLLSIFGYLIILIVYKWIHFNSENCSCAPSILIHLINMFLFTYSSEPCNAAVFYPNQKLIQELLILCAVICIPVLLLGKPLSMRAAAASKKKNYMMLHNELAVEEDVDEDEDAIPKPIVKPHSGEEEEEEFSFSDAMVHQSIHTIEYCLGCVSHTASYLRLWALSLAHAELSEVLWTMVFANGLGQSGGFVGATAVFVVFTPWAILSVAILLLMEGLSAFLHTLRLHWVEFQSKFYYGDGYLFEPFDFKLDREETT